MNMKFHILGKSCNRRQEEITMVRNFFLSNGWNETNRLGAADLAVFFACAGVRYLVADNVNEILETQRKMKSGAELIVGSCLPAMDNESLRKVFQGRTIMPTDFTALNDLPNISVRFEAMPKLWGKDAAPKKLNRPGFTTKVRMHLDDAALRCLTSLVANRPNLILKRATRWFRRRNTVAFSIAAGCSRKCTYCARPFASGKVRSKPVDVVVENIHRGLRYGFRAFDLHADSIGAYGADLQANLGDLLNRLLAMHERFSVGLYDVHPQDFIRFYDPIKRLCESCKLHHVYVAVQSGNDRILRLMKRPMDVEELAARLLDIRRYGNVYMQSAVIAGFPGETDEEFEDTIRLLKRIDFDSVYIHCYSDMPNTEASAMPAKVDREAMIRRLAAIKRAGISHDVGETTQEWGGNFVVYDEVGN